MNTEEKLRRIIRERQDREGPPTIRYLAKQLGLRQTVVHQLCEDAGLNINIGWSNGSGYATHDSVGDYTVEDLGAETETLTAPEGDYSLIKKIVDRACEEIPAAKEEGPVYLTADLVNCHARARFLDLERLLNSSAEDFAHDINGIRMRLDRRNGTLFDFVPRCARP